ncbi:MAG TPA: hypothetical protein VJ817_05770 [Gemmatimonadales bacterium]|nr:hypothetical protein [Gemmatimonadales bacterium]
MSLALLGFMHFRYRNSEGKVVRLNDVTWLARAVRSGLVTPDTPFAVGDDSDFRRAELVPAYQQVVVGLSRSPLDPQPPAIRSGAGHPAKSPLRFVVLFLFGALAGAIGWFMVRSSDLDPGGVVAAPATSAEMERALAALAGELGDSVATRQRRLELWVEQQAFEQRFSGRSLRIPASLQAARVAAGRYLAEVDGLMKGISVLAARLALRADSLEGTDGLRDGLFVATGELVREWEQDLRVYAQLQRATAATLDSVAEYALARQQSFALRDGQPVFLSRSDGARFRGFLSSLDQLARDQARWADQVRARRPEWMAALAPADRPAFRGPLLQRSNQ